MQPVLTKDPNTAVCLRESSDKPDQQKPDIALEETPEEETREEEEYILCRHCRQIITHPSQRTVINGSHAHTFANPHGMVYEIGCFRVVTGCGYTGAPTDEFTWFAGFSWRVALCGMCLTHLGWQFLSKNEQFNGLILDRLI